jgi:Tfp pilus assembly protein PilN
VRAVNLIPAEERRGAGGIAGRSGGVVYVITGGLAVLVVLGIVYAAAVHTVAQRKGQLATVTEQVAAVTAENDQLAPFVQFAQISAQQTQQTLSLANQRFDWPDAMEQLALALPSDVTLTSFTATDGATPSAAAATSSSGGPAFTLEGCASAQSEIPAVLTRLAAVPGVATVSLQSTAENKRAKHKVSAKAVEATTSGCPYLSFTLALDYDSSYTVPAVKGLSSGSGGAQTVSSSTGASTVVQTAKQQVTG